MGGREDREAVRARAQRWRQEQRRLRVAVRTAAPPDGALLKRIEELEAENARLATEAQNRVEDLPESAQKKVAIIERRLKREFDARFEPAVQAEAQKRLAEMMVPAVQRQLDDAEMVLRARKGDHVEGVVHQAAVRPPSRHAREHDAGRPQRAVAVRQ